MDLSLNPYNEIDFLFYKSYKQDRDFFFLDNFKDAIFLNSFNKTFNGIVEMLHYNSKIRFPKRFLLLKKNESSSNSFFWDFWCYPKNFLNSKFFIFENPSFDLFSDFFFKRNFFWMWNSKFFLNFFIVKSNFSKNFFWTSFFDLNEFSYEFFSSMANEKKIMKRRTDEIFSFSYNKKFFKDFFFDKFKNYKFNEFSFFFPFLGSTFWNMYLIFLFSSLIINLIYFLFLRINPLILLFSRIFLMAFFFQKF